MNLNVNKNTIVPVFYQIQEQIRNKIEREKLKPGTQLPTERELEAQLGVSRVTIRKAIRGLITEGYCTKRAGKGIFIADKKIKTDVHSLEGTTSLFAGLGKELETRLISRKVINPDARMIKYLQLPAVQPEEVLVLKRLRLVDDEPYILETTYLPLCIFPGMPNGDFNGSLYQMMDEQYGIKPHHASGIFNVMMSTEEDSKLLNVQLNTALLVKEVTVYTATNLPIEINKSVFRSDKFKFIVNSALKE